MERGGGTKGRRNKRGKKMKNTKNCAKICIYQKIIVLLWRFYEKDNI